jgi:hypothetical protein
MPVGARPRSARRSMPPRWRVDAKVKPGELAETLHREALDAGGVPRSGSHTYPNEAKVALDFSLTRKGQSVGLFGTPGTPITVAEGDQYSGHV